MIRLHFTAADLCRIVLAPAVDALSETALSLRLSLRPGRGPGAAAGRGGVPGRGGSGRGAGWPERPRSAARQWHRSLRGDAGAGAGVLAQLVTEDGFVPDFLLQPGAQGLADALGAVAATPVERLARDLGIPEATGWNGGLARPGRWAREFADGSPAAARALVGDTRRYFAAAVEPVWPRIRSDALTDRALRAEMLLRGGVDALLTTLGTTWRWQAPTLHLPSGSTYDIPLCGRGLLLVPSWFTTGPLVMYRPEAATVLVYPMYDGEVAGPEGGGERPEALAALLGRTRARVLALLRSPATTTALAERAGVSLAAASQHAGVLRGAGLVDTVRTGSAVLHSLTPLGWSLLAGV
ncbi:winged helix-turn-helix domain-containing protein [Streptomyces lateritius]|uniref:winged helix-turn-helix domain-containing protein n=1 Tax=Streptomyces lateritius TaxID=67313 RepID=UPI001C8CDE14|nr:winged helix-turn-helix domain-containing protein [Streptomyces lateritius]MBX9427305.1 winged helix-turn-helix domain-containing protein [Streptomyces lateritius]